MKDASFYELLEHIKLREGVKSDKWIEKIEAKKRLNIKSKTIIIAFQNIIS
jgi:hypothetical protein